MLVALALTGLTTFPVPVLGATWIVDDDGGIGVDFLTIQAALDAASPDDVVIVRPGAYASSTLTKGLRLIGEGGPAITGFFRVRDTPAGSIAVVSGLRTSGSGHGFLVLDCAGTVVAEDLQASSVFVTGSGDVRVRRNSTPSGWSALLAIESRVEVVECVFRATDATDQFCGIPLDPTGAPAAEVRGGSLHAARSSFQGGGGGDSWCGDLGLVEPGGDGGNGIVAWVAGTRVLVTGVTANTLAGGVGGSSFLYGQASDGLGIRIGDACSARVSGATIAGTDTYGSGSITTAVPDDPTLRLLELPAPGVNLTFRLTAPAGSTAEMRIGGAPAVVPVGGLEEDVLVARAQAFPMGVVPAGDVLGFNFAIPAHWRRGTTVFAQATVTYPGGEVRRTHSVPLVVR